MDFTGLYGKKVVGHLEGHRLEPTEFHYHWPGAEREVQADDRGKAIHGSRRAVYCCYRPGNHTSHLGCQYPKKTAAQRSKEPPEAGEGSWRRADCNSGGLATKAQSRMGQGGAPTQNERKATRGMRDWFAYFADSGIADLLLFQPAVPLYRMNRS